jgi:hypothetical protein
MQPTSGVNPIDMWQLMVMTLGTSSRRVLTSNTGPDSKKQKARSNGCFFKGRRDVGMDDSGMNEVSGYYNEKPCPHPMP